jgi:hypothetical protein
VANAIRDEVINNARVPDRPDDILAQSEHGAVLWRRLLQCWATTPGNRIKADDIDQFVGYFTFTVLRGID